MAAHIRVFWLKDWNRFIGALSTGLAAGAGAWVWQSAQDEGTGSVPGLTAALVGWIVFVLVHALWVGLSVRSMDAALTRRHARREDPRRAVREVLHIVAAVASVTSMGAMLLAADSDPMTRALNAGLGLAAVLGAWLIVQLMYMLRYAAIYYEDLSEARPAPIDFHAADHEPNYTDFAYFAFTVGTSFASSDSDVCSTRVRSAVLGHSLLSFFFGSVVLAAATSLMLQLLSIT